MDFDFTQLLPLSSEIQSRSHSVAEAEGTPRISSSALICRIFLAAMAEESSVRVKHTLNCNITLTVLLPQSEAQVIAGYASLIVIYGSFSNVAVQRSVVQIIQTSEKSLRFLRNAVHELLRLHAQADELGVDATQTSAGDLKSMQTRLDAALSVRDSKS